MKHLRFSFVVLLLVLTSQFQQIVFAQAQPSAKMLAANELLKSQRWAEAAKAYEEILNDEPKNARAWYQLGTARFSMQQFEAAIAAYEKNVAITSNATVMYNMACAYARLGQKEKALEWLDKAVNNPTPVFTNMAADPDLASLRDEGQFKSLLVAQDKQRRPCMYSVEARQFDFWVGEWDVFNPQGQKAGSSVIQQISAGCGILENWQDAFGNEGKSINFYDATTSKWYQYWIGASGGALRLSGVYKDGAMRYEGERAAANGSPILSRLTFFNLDANTVRQFAERSTDGGKTWAVTYDFKYVRKK